MKEHFEEVLNVRSESIDIKEACNIEKFLDIEMIETSPITTDEVKLKNGKSPGIDNINQNYLKKA